MLLIRKVGHDVKNKEVVDYEGTDGEDPVIEDWA
jgi:hypothetical protein